MSDMITLTAAEAEWAFQALTQEARRLDDWARIRCDDDAGRLIRDAADARVLAGRFAELAARLHANTCESCDASLDHGGQR